VALKPQYTEQTPSISKFSVWDITFDIKNGIEKEFFCITRPTVNKKNSTFFKQVN
jgi:hypothetical protein